MRSVRVALALLFAFAASLAAAQAFPSRSIRLIVDTSPGGLTDLLARLTAEALTVRLGQTVVVENKPGASGNVAADLLIRSPADGYTLMIAAAGNLAVKPFLERAVPFDPMVDIVPVINVADATHILVVSANMEAKDLAQFIAYARANPGKVYYGSAGIGSPPHLSLELFARLAGVKLMHVPYKGVGAALPDMLAGRLQAMSISLGSALPYLKTGQIRPLAAAARERLAGLPDVPTSAQAGLPGWEMSAWFAVFAPKGTPSDVSRFLNRVLQSAIDDRKVRQRLLDLGTEPGGGSVETTAERLRADHRLWGQVIRDAGIKLE
ncbi:MAG TPA: tripartite tricarboxylate transporter substrate binding protein [Burkholderiales bacterium]|nr:tripartite tricarboxylate transporter substrate binding protein [Burkholderiales bacterium]